MTENLGQEFIASPEISLQALYADTNKVTPLVFIQSIGSNPTEAFMKLAKERGYSNKYV